jgi:hypothetical protein
VNPDLARSLIRCFDTRMREELPQFHLLAADENSSGPVYRWKATSGLCFYIRLFPNPKPWKTCFTLDIAWSVHDHFPRQTVGRPTDEPVYGGILFRLPLLWRTEWPTKLEPWWWLGPRPSPTDFLRRHSDGGADKLEYVARQVEDAIQQLKTHALPYFKNVAARHSTE